MPRARRITRVKAGRTRSLLLDFGARKNGFAAGHLPATVFFWITVTGGRGARLCYDYRLLRAKLWPALP